MKQVVVTGSGIICPLGADKASTFAAALDARSGIGACPADIAARLPHIVVAQASVDPQTLLLCIGDRLTNVLNVLIQRAPQLFSAMFLTALGQQINHPPASFYHPIHTLLMVDKAEHLHFVQKALFGSPGIDIDDSLFLAV